MFSRVNCTNLENWSSFNSRLQHESESSSGRDWWTEKHQEGIRSQDSIGTVPSWPQTLLYPIKMCFPIKFLLCLFLKCVMCGNMYVQVCVFVCPLTKARGDHVLITPYLFPYLFPGALTESGTRLVASKLHQVVLCVCPPWSWHNKCLGLHAHTALTVPSLQPCDVVCIRDLYELR